MELKPGYKLTEMGGIPDDWEIKTIGEIGTVIRGASPRPKGDKRYYGGDIPRLMVEDVTRDKRWVTPSIDYLTLEGSKLSRLCKRGTLTIVCSGTPTVVGLPSLLAIDACIHDGMLALVRFTKKVSARFLFYGLASMQKQLHASATHGGTFVNLTTSGLKKFKVILPFTETEQEIIADILSDADALIESLEQLIAKKRNLKQGAMQELLTGKIRLPGFHGKCQVRRLGDVANTDPENLGSDTPPDFAFSYIALEDVDRGWLRSNSEQVFATAPSRARQKLRSNDVLVSTVRPNLQSHLLFTSKVGNWVCSTGFCVVRCRQGVTHPMYLFSHLFAVSVNRQIEALLTGSNYPAINSRDVRALQIPMPEYEEQAAIANVLSDMDTEILALEQQLTKTRALKQAMMQELLTGRIRLI